ncbi:uncharacterized protein LOC120268609 [Dioscorea cayenensis subsp. rotundata]|uniref:Uncharacterized protein LOC120268609 n=1 Tax=Dioscorea cayennensis subsp. rotundata TaxID=55577 RepID=A0AB40C049_DIOCR|nr:uncharacterized protein LOC120268609 [Dioscorea cayenensis subsp. rotundata]
MGKEVAKGILHGSDVASYDLLIWYAGFKCGCRPMLFLDGTHLLGKYGGILLGATAKDGNEGLFHLTFAIVDNETDDNWTWFISTLGDTIYGEDDYHKIITFILDRSKGLVNAIAKVFPSAPHGYCLRHLQEKFLKANGHLRKGLKDECWSLIVKIAYACTSSEYDASVQDDYLMYKRRENCMKWETHLCQEIHKKIEKNIEESRCLVIGRSDGDIFEVVDKQVNYVDLRNRTCSCHRWEVYGLPCQHACCAILQTDVNIHHFVEGYHTVALYKEAYESPIFPIPNHDKPMDVGRHLYIRPPISKKRPGRPRKRWIESQAFGVRDLHCSRCHEVRHNRATCNEVIAD